MTATFEDHLGEINALLDAGLRVAKDQSMPIAERAVELQRIVSRIDSHANVLELLAEGSGEAGDVAPVA